MTPSAMRCVHLVHLARLAAPASTTAGACARTYAQLSAPLWPGYVWLDRGSCSCCVEVGGIVCILFATLLLFAVPSLVPSLVHLLGGLI